MCDDRITDGQQVQIDQCLYCTRFEPVFGQVYELLNDTGMNVAAILDDNQMSYRDMKDFVANARYEKYMKEHEKTNVPATQNEVETRSQNEYSFRDRWGAGIAMDWTYVPKEEQKCHINWRQSINDDGSKIGRLGSWPYMYDRPNMIGKQNKAVDRSKSGSSAMKANVESMEGYKNIEPEQKNKVDKAIAAGKTAGEKAKSDEVKNRVCCDWQNQIIDAIKGKKGMDVATIASLMFCAGLEDVNTTVDKYEQAVKDVGTENPAVVIPAFMYGKEVIMGNAGSTKPVWEVPLYKPEEQDSGSGSGGDSSSSGSGNKPKERQKADPLDKGTIDSWLYGDALYVERLAKQVDGDIDMLPKVAYTYVAIEPLIKESPFDDGENVFPFTQKTLENVEVYYTSPFGMRTLDGETKLHRGIDLAAPEGTEFVAAHDGTITAAGDGWGSDDNAICLDHGNGQYSRYLHCSEILCSTGQTVKAGDVIGKVGNVGHSFGDHLHFEFCDGVSNETYSDKDPLSFYPKFNLNLDERVPSKLESPTQ